MSVAMRKNIIIGTIISIVVVICSFFVYSAFKEVNALPVVKDAITYELTKLDGSTATEQELLGKVKLVAFIFTRCPDICPATTINMVTMQNELKAQGLFQHQVEFVSISFDPDNDTPEVLNQYADNLGVDQTGWTFMRGEQEEIQRLSDYFNLSIVKFEDGVFAHSMTSLLLLDKQNRTRQVYRMGDDMETDSIITDIKALIKE